MGLTSFKAGYKLQQHASKHDKGEHIRPGYRAEHTAPSLSEKHWKQTDERETLNTDNIIKDKLNINCGDIQLKELTAVMKKLRRERATGPDGIPIEIFKELEEDNMIEVLEILNDRWENEDMPEEMLKAKVGAEKARLKAKIAEQKAELKRQLEAEKKALVESKKRELKKKLELEEARAKKKLKDKLKKLFD